MEAKSIAIINGVEIPAVVENGETYLPIKPICEAIGITFEPQFRKLKEDETLGSVIIIMITTGADGKSYEMVCLPLKFIYGWLFTINPGKVAPEAKGKVIKYRKECYEVLYDHFTGAGRKAQEQARLEAELINQKHTLAADLGRKQEEIREIKSKMCSLDQSLAKLSEERINPQPTLF